MAARDPAYPNGKWVARAAIVLALSVAPVARGQATQPAEADALVSLNLPENTPLKVLIDYYSQEFGVNILYDDQVANQRITIQAPSKLPRSAVPSLLDSALKMRGFALVDADHPGWKRVVSLSQAAKVPALNGPATQPAAAVTQVFKLQYTDATKLDTLVKPFLTQPGASSFPLAEQGLLVVTDYGSNLGRVSDLVRAVDQPSQDVAMEFLPVKHADPSRLTQQVDQLLKAKLRTQGGGDRLAGSIETGYDARTNTIVVIAPRDRIDDAKEIVRSLDTVVTEEQSPSQF
jgi:general secretion pathway protein D